MRKVLIPYFGSKRKIVNLLVETLDGVAYPLSISNSKLPDVRVDLFCGTAVWLASGPRAKLEIANDYDCYLINALRAIRSEPQTLVEKILSSFKSDVELRAMINALRIDKADELRSRLEADIDYYDVKKAAWWLLAYNMSIGHKVYMMKDSLLNMRSHGALTMSADELSSVLTDLSDRMRDVRITCRQFHVVMRGIFESGTYIQNTKCDLISMLVDPPYHVRSGKKNLYIKPNCSYVWSLAAREAVKYGDDPKHRIAVCGYYDDFTDSIFPKNWHRYRWQANLGMKSLKKTKKTKKDFLYKQECIWFSPYCTVPFCVEPSGS